MKTNPYRAGHSSSSPIYPSPGRRGCSSTAERSHSPIPVDGFAASSSSEPGIYQKLGAVEEPKKKGFWKGDSETNLGNVLKPLAVAGTTLAALALGGGPGLALGVGAVSGGVLARSKKATAIGACVLGGALTASGLGWAGIPLIASGFLLATN